MKLTLLLVAGKDGIADLGDLQASIHGMPAFRICFEQKLQCDIVVPLESMHVCICCLPDQVLIRLLLSNIC